MSWGSKQTTTSTNTGNSAYNNTTTPIQQPGVANLQQSILGQVPGLINQANAPVYGQAATAGYIQNLNDLANSASKHLASSLSGRGQLLSGTAEAGQQGIEQGRLSAATNFYSQLPFAERAAHLQNLSGALNTGMSLSAALPMGQQSQGTGSQSGNGTQITTSNPGLGSLVGGLAGIAGGAALGGFGSMLGGGSFGGGFGQALNPYGGGGGYQPNYGGYGMPSMQVPRWNPAVPSGNFSPNMQGYGPMQFPNQ